MAQPRRAHALDAHALDADLVRVLQGMWDGVCGHAGTETVDKLRPELEASLRGVLWYLSTWRGSASLGQQMQNLHCVAATSPLLPATLQRAGTTLPLASVDIRANAVPKAVMPRRTRLLFGLLTVLLPWAWSRASRAMSSPDHPERMRWWRLMRRLEGAVHAASLACTLFFLADGRYPTLPMALLRLRLAYTRPGAPRYAEFDLMNQQLAWQAISDTLSAARTMLAPVSSVTHPSATAAAAAAAPPPGYFGWLLRHLRVRAAARALPAHACGFCGAAPMHTPQLAPCGHVFCYYCLASACVASGRPRCPRCSARLTLGRRCQIPLPPTPSSVAAEAAEEAEEAAPDEEDVDSTAEDETTPTPDGEGGAESGEDTGEAGEDTGEAGEDIGEAGEDTGEAGEVWIR